jgi:hypothetical protein
MFDRIDPNLTAWLVALFVVAVVLLVLAVTLSMVLAAAKRALANFQRVEFYRVDGKVVASATLDDWRPERVELGPELEPKEPIA